MTASVECANKSLCESSLEQRSLPLISEESASRYHTTEVCVTRRPALSVAPGSLFGDDGVSKIIKNKLGGDAKSRLMGTLGPQPWLFLTIQRRGTKDERKGAGWRVGTSRKWRQKRQCGFGEEEAPLPAGKMLLSTLGPGLADFQFPSAAEAGARWKLATVTRTGSMRR